MKEHDFSVSIETLFLHIWANKHKGSDLYTHLRHQLKGYRSRKSCYSSPSKIKNRVSIHDRPVAVDAKTHIGNWEIDLMIGKDHSGALVTIVEWVSKFTVTMTNRQQLSQRLPSPC